ncbi:hypothetical protein [Fluviispira vulneris]|uniref:hypothetical protein n=1 Tax=Fluviispira vulneris TaxID=2763012 RepID=UPI001647803B|nr:hypothetical protein [Fluviispira vulneris]
MTQNCSIIKITLLTFSEYKKLKKKIPENIFYEKLVHALIENKNIFLNPFLEKDFSDIFIYTLRSLCEFEAMTFLPDESLSEYNTTKNKVKVLCENLQAICHKNDYTLLNYFTENDFRKFIAFCDCFAEWCKEIKYFKLSEDEKIILLAESPLISLCRL